MPKFMLLLHDNPEPFMAMSPDDMQKAIEKYVAWGAKLREAGILADSKKLTDEPGRVVRGHGKDIRVTDGPYSETKEVFGGYYTITADNYEQAIDRARDCPSLQFGGTMEVRQIDEYLA
jgi:hypothetical protein